MNIKELKKLEEEATPVSWESLKLSGVGGPNAIRMAYKPPSGRTFYGVQAIYRDEDAALIVALRNNAAALIKVAEAAKRHYDAYRYDGSDTECLDADDALFAALAALRGGEGEGK